MMNDKTKRDFHKNPNRPQELCMGHHRSVVILAHCLAYLRRVLHSQDIDRISLSWLWYDKSGIPDADRAFFEILCNASACAALDIARYLLLHLQIYIKSEA